MVKWSPKPESSGFLPVAKDHTASQCNLGEGGRAPGPPVALGFRWRIPALGYKSKSTEEAQPPSCPPVPEKGGVHLCL